MNTILLTLIAEKIQQAGGKIPFAEFMHHALYTPNLGYYSANNAILGKQGDFTTAPESSPLFGQAIANHCQQVLSQVNNPTVLEFGAGSGKLCIDVLTQLEKRDALPEKYLILEVSAFLKERQRLAIEQSIPHLIDKIQWLDSWPEKPFNGVMLANEVLDAMPVHRFKWQKQEVFESYIQSPEAGSFTENFEPSDNPHLIQHVKALNLPQDHYQSEANLFIDDWIKQCYECIATGSALLIDYGFVQSEYYHPDRANGTLMCHHQHKAHPNPLINIGEQDITAHVNFSHVAEMAHQCGWQVASFTTQASFLLANGLLSLLEAISDEKEYLTASQQVKLLTHPAEMGELFKVMALSKNIELENCHLTDMRFRL